VRGHEHEHEGRIGRHRGIVLPSLAALPFVAAAPSRGRALALACRLLSSTERKGELMTTDSKLSSQTVWLFAFGSIAAGIATSYAMSGLGQKVTAAVYFAIVAIGGFLSTYLTRARVRGAVLAFLTAAAVAGVAYFFLVDHVFRTVTTVAGDAVSAGAAHEQAAEAGAEMGRTFGIFIGAMVFLETIIAGIGGAVAGAKTRGKGGFAALGAAARSAR
jgi:hypothetical protein